MAGRKQPGIRDAYTPISPRVAERGTPGRVAGKAPSISSPYSKFSGMASPYGRFSKYAQAAAKRNEKQQAEQQDDGGNWFTNAASFVGNEMLGLDDFGWAVKNAQQGNWWDAAKSLGAGVLELGDTVASGAAIVLSGGTATPLVAGKYAAKTAAKQVAKQGAEQAMKAVDDKIAKRLIESAGGKKIEKTVLKDVAKDEKSLSKMDVKFPDQMAKDLMDDLNPFKRPQLGKGKNGTGKNGTGTRGETPGGTTGSQTPSNRPGVGGERSGLDGIGGGGVRNADELATVGANRAGAARHADDFREPLSRPVQPKNNRPIQPGASQSGQAVEEAVEQTVLRSNAEDVLKTGGLTLKGRRLLPAGILGMGLSSQAGLITGVTPGTLVTPTLSVPTATTTSTGTQTTGTGGGGGGGRKPAFDTGGGKIGADVTIPYTY